MPRTRPGLLPFLLAFGAGLPAADVEVGSALGRCRIHLDAHPPAGERAASAAVEPTARSGPTRVSVTRQVVLRPVAPERLPGLAARHRFQVIAGSPDGTWSVTATNDDPLAGCMLAQDLADDPDVAWAEAQLRWPAHVKATPDDPLFPTQWALANDGSVAGTTAGIDIRATAAWDLARGLGQVVAIVDTGIDYHHPDLSPGLVSALALDLWETDGGPAGPLPTLPSEAHGTVTAGLAVARGFNGVGICGAAPSAGLAPVRLVVYPFADTVAAQALQVGITPPTPGGPTVDVSSNSWGADDDGLTFKPVSSTLASALAYGASHGRHGCGTVYVFAAGNGGASDDTAYDGYQQYRQVMAVGAVNSLGGNASYAEAGADLFVAAPSGDGTDAGSVSTDRLASEGLAAGDYLAPADHALGSSFAAPLVSGVVALILEANPALTWRDVQHLIATTARPLGGGFQINGAGLSHHHQQGFGLIDAAAAVAAAPGWSPVPEESSVVASGLGSGAIPDAGTQTLTFDLSGAGDLRAEAVQLTVTVTHGRWSDLDFALRSPAGTTAAIRARPLDANADTRTLTVVCRPFLDEAVAGVWTLSIADQAAGATGTSSAPQLTVYGWRPRPVPAPAAVLPTLVRAGDPSATVTISGLGFANDAAGLRPVTTATWTRGAASGSANVLAVTGTTSLTVQLPGGALAGIAGDTILITVSNPAFAGLGGGSGGPIAVGLRGNAPPTLADGSLSAAVGRSASLTLAASDADGDALTYTASPSALGTVACSGGVLTFTAATLGSDAITVTVDDGHGGIANATYTLTATAPPAARAAGDGSGGHCGGGLFGVGLLGLMPLLTWRRVRGSKTPRR